MNMETSPNFTPKAQQLIARSKVVATSLNHKSVDAAHLLLVILNSKNDLVEEFMFSHGFSIKEITSFVITFCDLEKKHEKVESCNFNPTFNALLSGAFEFSKELKDSYVGVEHLFFCLLNSMDGALYNFFKSHGFKPKTVVETFLILMRSADKFDELISQLPQDKSQSNSAPSTSSQNKSSESALENFGTNLNSLCRHGKIGEIIGKQEEISRACEILCRKIKNNPILIGDPGVGKTAVVEGLAHEIVKGRVPPFLLDKEIYSIDLASMIAGTKYRGQFEQRIKALIKECKEDERIILFIDETHTIVGAGSAEGAMDAANILKPALARGELKLIGATTFPEFKKNIEKDVALTRRFESIQVEEPSPEECLAILKGIKRSYESFHGVKYPVNVLKTIVSLCDLYLPSRKFPDKAIDVMDEAGSKVKIRNATPPKAIQEIERKLYDLIDLDRSEEEQDMLLKDYDKLMDKWQLTSTDPVSDQDILNVISQKAKVPKENLILEKDNKTKLVQKSLLKDVVNQKEAVSALSRCILRAKIGLKEHKKPIGSFLFLGASGVGKTWTAKRLAKHHFGSEKNMFRFDMSEYSEKVSSSKLIGAAPGYVGYEEGGALIESMKKRPHCVLLFDEIEKAHPEVQQLLLQILEEGEIEDNNGYTAYFKDTIVILTSNIGSELTTKSTLGFAPDSNSNSTKIHDTAKKILSPELVNRLNQVIIFNHLEKEHLTKIFKSETSKLKKKLRNKKIKIDYSPEVIDWICDTSAEEKMGARPLKRLIQQNIEDQIVNFYFENEDSDNTSFYFYLKNDDIVYDIV
jgi:ATP-dependent Clp protease ATP-binding subunit ClpC